MKLAVKLAVALILGIVAVMGVYAAVQISDEVVLSAADAARARRNCLAWLGTIESVWAREGEERARELVRISARRAGTHEEAIRVVPLVAGVSGDESLSAAELRTLADGDIVRRTVRDGDGADWQKAWVEIRTAARPTAIELVEPLEEEQSF